MDLRKVLEIRLAFAEEMVRYFSQPHLFVGPEVDTDDVLLPVGMSLPDGLSERSLSPVTPFEYWMREAAFVRLLIDRWDAQPLLPAVTEDAPVPLPDHFGTAVAL